MRKVQKDGKGIYVVNDRRKFRPDPNVATAYVKGQQTSITRGYGATRLPEDQLEVKFFDVQQRAYINAETWTTTDDFPQVKEKLKKGQIDLTVKAMRPSRTPAAPIQADRIVVVGADGVNYRGWRKEPSSHAQKGTAGANILIPEAIMFSWDQWDALVQRIAQARDEVSVGPIVAALTEEVEAEENLQEYLKEKGLV
jgi:hypothetical protein